MTNGNLPRKNNRLLRRILDGRSDANIRFDELRRLMYWLGFSERIRGSHHIYRKPVWMRKSTYNRSEAWPRNIRRGNRKLYSSNTDLGLVGLKYEIIIYWSEQDGHYIAEVPELPGCMADGETLEETLTMVQEVMQLWIETASEYGGPIPEPKGRRLMFA